MKYHCPPSEAALAAPAANKHNQPQVILRQCWTFFLRIVALKSRKGCHETLSQSHFLLQEIIARHAGLRALQEGRGLSELHVERIWEFLTLSFVVRWLKNT